jgi:multimeric flavodoxin WrbA
MSSENGEAADDETEPRTGTPETRLNETEFRRRFLERFRDPAFHVLGPQLDDIAHAAWDAYSHHRKSPHTRPAGKGYADPAYQLALDWIHTRDAIEAARRRHDNPSGRTRLLLIVASPRNEHSCPGEMSKSYRLMEIARDALAARGAEIETLDLSRLTSEYGRTIHPCKACFSTAAPLCHWPCSCYPNYSLGQTNDWMNAIYPMWVAAHGVMIVTPVHWYQATSPLKLMMDRLVCADGGNPDPTATNGKDAAKAKRIELGGWHYPHHLAGRHFAVVVHGDAEGTESVRRALADWMASIGMRPAGRLAELDRYVGYWKPYATSHRYLDADTALQDEVRNAALTLFEAIEAARRTDRPVPGEDLEEPRRK